MILIGAAFVLLADAAVARPARIAIPNGLQLLIMIKTTLVAFNQANLTGNYTVLRDLAAPGFQQANTAARLGDIFRRERGKDIDISPIVLLQPQLFRAAFVDKQGLLRIEGYFPSKPDLVSFRLTFQAIAGRWRLFSLGVGTVPRSALRPPPSNSQIVAQRWGSRRVLSANEFGSGTLPSWVRGLRVPD